MKLELPHHDCPAARYGRGDTPQWCCWQHHLQGLPPFSFLGTFILQNISQILPHEAAGERCDNVVSSWVKNEHVVGYVKHLVADAKPLERETSTCPARQPRYV